MNLLRKQLKEQREIKRWSPGETAQTQTAAESEPERSRVRAGCGARPGRLQVRLGYLAGGFWCPREEEEEQGERRRRRRRRELKRAHRV